MQIENDFKIRVRELESIEPKVLWRYLENSTEKYPEKEAIIFENQRITYKELNRNVDLLAKGFLEIGIKKGDRIAAIIPTHPEFMYCYLAAAKLGAIIVGINTRYRESELQYIINNAKPKAVVMINRFEDWDCSSIMKPLLPKLQNIKKYIVIGETDFPDAVQLDELMSVRRDELDKQLNQRKQQVKENDGIFIVYTSGTTGSPKGALISHKNIIANIIGQTYGFKTISNERWLCHVPLVHVGGVNANAMAAIMNGVTLIMMDTFKAEDTLKIIEKEKITFAPQVPTMWVLELNLNNFEDYDLSSLRVAEMGGSSVPPELIRQIKNKLKIDTIVGYGLTEASGYICCTSIDDPLDKKETSVGRAFPRVEIKILDDKHNEVQSGREGEIAIRGECVIKEYFNMPEETANSFDQNGWFCTGDMGIIDKEGYLSIVGRKKEMYISGGYNVYPREIEEFLMKHSKVLTAACIGVNDSVLGEIGRAYIIPKSNVELTEKELLEYCRDKIANYKIPKQFVFRESLPMTSLGKINKSKLIEESKNE